eukprot:scaffold965_cov262-Pinguiococcus_pyrenoidosus.AAC.4
MARGDPRHVDEVGEHAAVLQTLVHADVQREVVACLAHLVVDGDVLNYLAKLVHRADASIGYHLLLHLGPIQAQDAAQAGGAEPLGDAVIVRISQHHQQLDATLVHHLHDARLVILQQPEHRSCASS